MEEKRCASRAGHLRARDEASGSWEKTLPRGLPREAEGGAESLLNASLGKPTNLPPGHSKASSTVLPSSYPSGGAAHGTHTPGAACFRSAHRCPAPSPPSMPSGLCSDFLPEERRRGEGSAGNKASSPHPTKFPSHSSKRLHVHQLLNLGRSF